MPKDDRQEAQAKEMLESVRIAAQEVSSPRTRRLSALALAEVAAAASAGESEDSQKITFFADKPGQPAPTGATSDHYTNVTGETPHTYTEVTEDHYTEVTRTPVNPESEYFTATEGRSSRAETDAASIATVVREPESPETSLLDQAYEHLKHHNMIEAYNCASQAFKQTGSYESMNLLGVLKILPLELKQIDDAIVSDALDHLCVLVDENNPKYIFYLAARGHIKAYFPENELAALDDLKKVKQLTPNYPGIDRKIEELTKRAFQVMESRLSFMGGM